jgi:hypothetical protein
MNYVQHGGLPSQVRYLIGRDALIRWHRPLPLQEGIWAVAVGTRCMGYCTTGTCVLDRRRLKTQADKQLWHLLTLPDRISHVQGSFLASQVGCVTLAIRFLIFFEAQRIDEKI